MRPWTSTKNSGVADPACSAPSLRSSLRSPRNVFPMFLPGLTNTRVPLTPPSVLLLVVDSAPRRPNCASSIPASLPPSAASERLSGRPATSSTTGDPASTTLCPLPRRWGVWGWSWRPSTLVPLRVPRSTTVSTAESSERCKVACAREQLSCSTRSGGAASLPNVTACPASSLTSPVSLPSRTSTSRTLTTLAAAFASSSASRLFFR
mmetsp:Transcript_26108/g.40120  ORF Transcript_26108/g.40120 Transcript_26108/m.40120 type:complete len:207 (-) Transcript_26108:2212-2832(-)